MESAGILKHAKAEALPSRKQANRQSTRKENFWFWFCFGQGGKDLQGANMDCFCDPTEHV